MATNTDQLLANIKQEQIDESFDPVRQANTLVEANNCTDTEDTQTEEVYNSALIEDLKPNEQINNDISRFMANRSEEKNRKNLINYCGILDPSSETDSCARVNSIYVAKFGKSHIKSKYFFFWR